MHRKFYCGVCKTKTIFTEHSSKKGTWICTACRFTTSNPVKEPRIPNPNLNSMKNFYKSIVNKSREVKK